MKCGCKVRSYHYTYGTISPGQDDIIYCPLHASAEAMLEALRRLADAAGVVGDLDHAGAQVPAEAWAEMYAAHCVARAVIPQAERK